MKKIVSIIIIGSLIIGGLGVVGFPNEISQENKTIHFSDLSIDENKNFTTLQLEGANSLLMKYNHYMVPIRIETFTFPFGTQIDTINCIPSNIHSEMISKELQISPEPLMLKRNAIQQNKKSDVSSFAVTEWFTFDIGTGIINNERNIILKVQLFPVQYHPLKNSIEWAEDIDIEIKYREPKKSVGSANEFDFLVLTPSQYAEGLEELIIHKNNRGLKTILVTLDDIYLEQYFPSNGRDEPEKIKYFIKNAIESWGITSVLLVGGFDAFPTRMTHVYVEYFNVDEPFVSDLYYADIYDKDGFFSSWDSNGNDVFAEHDWGSQHLYDEIDLYPDVHIGRLACINETEVTTCVNKIITYENNQAYTQDWFTNLVVIGGDTFTDDTWGINEGEYINEIVMNMLDGFIPEKIWDSNGRLHGFSSVNVLSDAINKGCGFVDFSGHGYYNQWATHPNQDENTWLPEPWGYFNSHVSDLMNGDKLPIVILGACSTCKFDIIDDCLGWSFLANPNGGGIGSFGVTTFGYANGNGKQISGGFIEEITMNIFEVYKERANDGLLITFGEMWSTSMIDYICPNMEVRDYATLESWQSFGDPTLEVAGESQVPERPTKPSGPISVKPGTSYSYSSSTTDMDRDKVYYLFDWGDGELSGWIGPFNSSETVDANHSWGSRGRYQIRVKAKDINGVQSEWSDSLPVSASKNKIFSIFLQLFEKSNWLFPF